MKEEGSTAPSSVVAFYLECIRVEQVDLYYRKHFIALTSRAAGSAAADVSVILLCSLPENIFLPESSFETVTQRILHTHPSRWPQ